MGYLTKYKLTVKRHKGKSFNMPAIQKELRKINQEEVLYAIWPESQKWYNWKTDMVRLSTLHPNAHFILNGEGEESDDLWKAHFVAGKHAMYRPTLKWPRYLEVDLL